jgi:hypothetical protein
MAAQPPPTPTTRPRPRRRTIDSRGDDRRAFIQSPARAAVAAVLLARTSPTAGGFQAPGRWLAVVLVLQHRPRCEADWHAGGAAAGAADAAQCRRAVGSRSDQRPAPAGAAVGLAAGAAVPARGPPPNLASIIAAAQLAPPPPPDGCSVRGERPESQGVNSLPNTWNQMPGRSAPCGPIARPGLLGFLHCPSTD